MSSLLKEVYNPKTVFPHAASLGQAFAHCPIFPTAASRRSLGRVSVPMWPADLSVRLPIVALVGRYPANWLIGRKLIFQRIAPLVQERCLLCTLCGISVRFQTLSPSERQIAYALLTRSPLSCYSICRSFINNNSVRLACVKHAASVRPEPGSNSLLYLRKFVRLFKPFWLVCVRYYLFVIINSKLI